MQVTEAILHYFQYAARRVHTLFVLQLDYIEAVADRITKIKNILENLTGGSEGKSETVNNKNNHVAAKLSAGFNTLQSGKPLIQIHSDMWRLRNWQFFAADYNEQTATGVGAVMPIVCATSTSGHRRSPKCYAGN